MPQPLRSASSTTKLRSAALGCCLGLLVVPGCADDIGDEPNIFPSDGTTAAATGTSTTMTTTPAGSSMSVTSLPTGDATDTAVAQVPRAYRFDCIDIQGIGDAGPTAIQAQILENTWDQDIQDIKINILLEIADEDLAAGTAQIGIRSGVGLDPNALCTEPSGDTPILDIQVVEGEERWIPSAEFGACSAPGTGTGLTYLMTLANEDLVYIYSEDDNTVAFNCTPDQAVPDAVPLRAVQAEVSVEPTLQTVSGSLTGCLTLREGSGLCSCLGSCAATGPDDVQSEGECMGCPEGGVPLTTLLGGVGPSDNCTALTGEPAFDLIIGFTATRLPDVPTSCG